MKFSFQMVPLSAIDPSDDAYRITTEPGIEKLTVSIRTVGIISPPVLKQGAGPFRIISGFRRVAVCRHLSMTKIPARIVPESAEPHALAVMAVSDNALQRPLNLVESSRAFTLLLSCCDSPEDLPSLARQAGLPDNRNMIEKLLPLCRLPEPIQDGLLTGAISLPSALELSRLGPEAGMAFAFIFNTLRFSASKQRELIVNATEIAFRDDLPLLQVLSAPSIQEAIDRETEDKALRAETIRAYLKGRRYPEITRAETAFDRCVKSLKLGDGIQLVSPPHFEGMRYAFHLSFQNLRELDDRLSALERVRRNPEFTHLFH